MMFQTSYVYIQKELQNTDFDLLFLQLQWHGKIYLIALLIWILLFLILFFFHDFLKLKFSLLHIWSKRGPLP